LVLCIYKTILLIILFVPSTLKVINQFVTKNFIGNTQNRKKNLSKQFLPRIQKMTFEIRKQQ
jgi:hypothetical protein